MSLSFGRSLDLMLIMINSLQIAIHLPIMGIGFPSNAMTYISSMIPIVMFDVLEGQDWFESIFRSNKGGEMVDIEPYTYQIGELGYESYNPFLNLGTISLWLMIYFTKFIILLFVLFPLRKSIKGKKYFKQMKNQLFFSEFLTLFLECYLELIICGFLIWEVPPSHLDNQLYSKVISVILMFIAVIIIPGFIIFILNRDVS